MSDILAEQETIITYAYGDADKVTCLNRLDACHQAATDALALAKGTP